MCSKYSKIFIEFKKIITILLNNAIFKIGLISPSSLKDLLVKYSFSISVSILNFFLVTSYFLYFKSKKTFFEIPLYLYLHGLLLFDIPVLY